MRACCWRSIRRSRRDVVHLLLVVPWMVFQAGCVSDAEPAERVTRAALNVSGFLLQSVLGPSDDRSDFERELEWQQIVDSHGKIKPGNRIDP